MTTRIGLFIGLLVLAVVAFRHPAPRPAIDVPVRAAVPSPSSDGRSMHRHGRDRDPGDAVVYVAGAVRKPGLYHLRFGERAAGAVAAAGGLSVTADPGGVNLAARAADGDEIYVPSLGETTSRRRGVRKSHRRASPALATVDVNAADAAELARVPGIGSSIAERILEMRALDGSFHTFDELLDVSGMTQSRLERARPYFRPLGGS